MFRKYLYSNFSSEIERLSVCMLGEGVKKGQIKRSDMKPVLFDEILTSQSTFGKQTYTHTHTLPPAFGLEKRDENKTSNKLHLDVFTFYLIACRWHL